MTASRALPVQLGEVTVLKGQRVGLSYGSANYGEDVFRDPKTFDMIRDPNPHLGFGGTGPHYCLGANLARMELNIVLDAIADLLPDIELARPSVRSYSGWGEGIRQLPIRFAN